MTVIRDTVDLEKPGHVDCEWQDKDGDIKGHSFPEDALVKDAGQLLTAAQTAQP
jgi:uncharacterized protein YodC (DUF2158 family)